MEDREYGIHLSSIGNLEAKVVVLAMYIIAMLTTFSSKIAFCAWLVPFIVFLIEKDSMFVKFHSMQCFLLNITIKVIGIIISILFGGAGIAVYLLGVVGALAVGFSAILMIIVFLVSIAILVCELIVAIKAYKYEEKKLPIVGNWAERIVYKESTY